VLFVDKQPAGRTIWGWSHATEIDTGGAFATVDHCFVAIEEGDRLVRAAIEYHAAFRTRRWTNLTPLIPGVTKLLRPMSRELVRTPVDEQCNEGFWNAIADFDPTIEYEFLPLDEWVYDLVTDSHTYIVEHLAVWDDFPQIDVYPHLAGFAVLVADWFASQTVAMPDDVRVEPLPRSIRSSLQSWLFEQLYDASWATHFAPREPQMTVDPSSSAHWMRRFVESASNSLWVHAAAWAWHFACRLPSSIRGSNCVELQRILDGLYSRHDSMSAWTPPAPSSLPSIDTSVAPPKYERPTGIRRDLDLTYDCI